MSGCLKKGVLALAVPATTGTYTDTFVGQPTPASAAQNQVGNQALLGLTAVLLTGFPSGAIVELWYLQPTDGIDPTSIGNYALGSQILTAAGATTVPLASYPGVLIRAKSGGTAGTATVWFTVDG